MNKQVPITTDIVDSLATAAETYGGIDTADIRAAKRRSDKTQVAVNQGEGVHVPVEGVQVKFSNLDLPAAVLRAACVDLHTTKGFRKAQFVQKNGGVIVYAAR